VHLQFFKKLEPALRMALYGLLILVKLVPMEQSVRTDQSEISGIKDGDGRSGLCCVEQSLKPEEHISPILREVIHK